MIVRVSDIRRIVSEELRRLDEKMVPVGKSLDAWEKMKTSPAEYHKKNPGAKWRIVHCHGADRGETVGRTSKERSSNTNMSYSAAGKKHGAMKS